MRANATYYAPAAPQLGTAARLWLNATRLFANAAVRAAWAGVYRITKARILLEHDPGRPARRP